NTVVGGAAGSGDPGNLQATAGAASGAGIFLQGNGTLNLAPAVGTTQTISNSIVDEHALGGSGSWNVSMNGAGTANLGAANQFSGNITKNKGVLNTRVDKALGANSNPAVNGGTLAIGSTSQFVNSLTTTGG